MGNKKRMLAVLAHPDDESFGMGGTLALYAARGVEVHLICATRGEVGEMDAEFMKGYNTIAERREAELRCAAEHLGLKAVHFLDYRDSGMEGSQDNRHPNALAAQPVEEVAKKVAALMETLQPEIVLTFDPIGGYKHPDHIAIHRATVKAFHYLRANNPQQSPKRLYYHVFPRKGMHVLVRILSLLGKNPRQWGKNGDIDLVALTEEGNFPTHALIDYHSVLDRKEAASSCHASQLGGGFSSHWLVRLFFRKRNFKDHFMQAFPEVTGKKKASDLFV